MKKIIIISSIIATLLTIALIAIYDLEVALTVLLTIVLIGLIALTIGMVWYGVVEISAEIKRRRNKYITFRWYSIKTSGTETVLERNYKAKKDFLKEAFGAYRFEIIETR